MDDRDSFTMMRMPTPARPLLGLTVLLVEDSRYASEAMRLLCMRSGARIRRADCLRSARRHLQIYRPSLLIVDLGLPDGSGLDLIDEAHRAAPRISIILGTSADDSAARACLQAGADGFLAKPLHSLAYFQTEMRKFIPDVIQPEGPFVLQDEVINPDMIAYRDDLGHVAELLGGGFGSVGTNGPQGGLHDGPDAQDLHYLTQFLDGVAGLAGDRPLLNASRALRKAHQQGQPLHSELALLSGLLQERLSDRVAI